jgi:hypothetical protein
VLTSPKPCRKKPNAELSFEQGGPLLLLLECAACCLLLPLLLQPQGPLLPQTITPHSKL